MFEDGVDRDRKEGIKSEIMSIFNGLELKIEVARGDYSEVAQLEIDKMESRLEQDLASIKLIILGARMSFEKDEKADAFNSIETANQWAINEWNRTGDKRFYELAEKIYDLMDLFEGLI